MKKQRRLEDLYIVGKEMKLDDGGGEPVVVWLQKLNPMEHEKAFRRANAVRARMLIARHNQETDEWQEAYADTEDLGSREQLVEYLMGEELAKARESAEAELSHAEEWKKDEYLIGLHDAWADEEHPLSDVYAENPDDEEARRVFLELKRFDDQVTEKIQSVAVGLRKDYDSLSDSEIQRSAAEKLVEMKAGLEWLREFRACEVWLATREPGDHKAAYFPSRETVDCLSSEVFQQLSDEYQKLTVSVDQGKKLPSVASSSPSSEPSEKEEATPSGLVVVPQ